jgi:hypothetical protein
MLGDMDAVGAVGGAGLAVPRPTSKPFTAKLKRLINESRVIRVRR